MMDIQSPIRRPIQNWSRGVAFAAALALIMPLQGCLRDGDKINEAGMIGGSRRPQAIANSFKPPPEPVHPSLKPQDAALLSTSEVKPAAGAGLTVSTTAFAPDGKIPYRYSDYGEKISPDLTFSNVPPETKSLVLLVEDPDAKEPKPFIHWVMYNLPPAVASLPESVPGSLKLGDFGDAMQGMNSKGSVGYTGMHPPYGDRAHHYHFQIFALDQLLPLPPGADRATVRAAMNGHVISSGEIVGTYAAN